MAVPSQSSRCRQARALENYRIVRTLASGGFSIVYLAHDENDAPVAIKEYLPSTLAVAHGRRRSAEVAGGRPRDVPLRREMLLRGRPRARRRCTHPNVVRVLNFFRANETVYMVMRYERGRTLQEHIQRRRGALAESLGPLAPSRSS